MTQIRMGIDSLRPLVLGQAHDNNTTQVVIDCGSWTERYPILDSYNIAITLPNGYEYIADASMLGDELVWIVCAGDTSVPGEGMYQIIAYSKYGDRRASKKEQLQIHENMRGIDGDTPAAAKPWVDKVIMASMSAHEDADRAEKAAENIAHLPIVGENGNWWLWDQVSGQYVDSGHTSRPDAPVPTIPVKSVNGKTGAVQLTAEDVGAADAAETEAALGSLSEEKIDKTSIVQTTGDSETAVMSQDAVTSELNQLSEAMSDVSERTPFVVNSNNELCMEVE